MIVFRLEPINALRRDFVIAGGVFLDPCLKAKGAVSHRTHGYEPSGFKFIHGAPEGIAADEYFRFRQIDVSHGGMIVTSPPQSSPKPALVAPWLESAVHATMPDMRRRPPAVRVPPWLQVGD